MSRSPKATPRPSTNNNQHKLYGDKLIAFFRETAPPRCPASAAKAKKSAAPAQKRRRKSPCGFGPVGDINYVEGFGNVRMDTATEIIRGERGTYNIDSGMATLDGNVKITQGSNQLNGRLCAWSMSRAAPAGCLQQRRASRRCPASKKTRGCAP